MLALISRQRPFSATIMPDRVPRAGGFTRGLNRPLRIVGAPNAPLDFRDEPGRSPELPPVQPRSFVPVAGSGPVPVRAEVLQGAWTLRFGLFGCPDDETRGGVARIERGRLFGGDTHFAFDGYWTLRGTEVTAWLHIQRHGEEGALLTLFGTGENEYRADCTAEVITRDLIEGRIKRPGFPDARLTMRRLPFRPR